MAYPALTLSFEDQLTLHLQEILISRSLLDTALADGKAERTSDFFPLTFSEDGRLLTRVYADEDPSKVNA